MTALYMLQKTASIKAKIKKYLCTGYFITHLPTHEIYSVFSLVGCMVLATLPILKP